jgi:hypothetical protein
MITWQNITVGQYQDLYSLIKADIDPLDKEVQCIAMLSNRTIEQVESLPLDKYKALRLATTWVLNEPPKGKPIKSFGKYRFIRKVQDLDTGRYISLQSFLQMDLIDNLHNLTACIVKPKWGKYDGAKHEQYANDCRNAPFLALYQTMLFFCNLFNDTMKALEPYLIEQLKQNPQMKRRLLDHSLQVLSDTLAGLPMQKE